MSLKSNRQKLSFYYLNGFAQQNLEFESIMQRNFLCVLNQAFFLAIFRKNSRKINSRNRKTQVNFQKNSSKNAKNLKIRQLWPTRSTFQVTFFLVLLKNNALMYFYETPVLLSRSFREFSRRLGKKWRIFEKNSRIFTKKLKDLDKKLKEFCQKLINPATLSWWWLLKNGQKKPDLIHMYCKYIVYTTHTTNVHRRSISTSNPY